jgi:hypothetical protein
VPAIDPTKNRPATVKVKAHTRAAPAPKPVAPKIRARVVAAAGPGHQRSATAPLHAKPAVRNDVPTDASMAKARVYNERPIPATYPARYGAQRAAQGPVTNANAFSHLAPLPVAVDKRAVARERALHPPKPGHGFDPLFAVVHPSATLATAGAGLAKAAKAEVGAIAHGGIGLGAFTPAASREVGKAGSDAAELAVTTPTSVAHLAGQGVGVGKDLATGHPGKALKDTKAIGKELAAPYVEFYHHPGQAIADHPVSTALMLAPAVRMPGRVVGYLARKAGLQTLARPAATLPGTALKEARTGSRDVLVRAVQSRADRKAPAPVVTVKEVQRRVDEAYDAAKHHTRRVVAAAARNEKAAAKAEGLPRAEVRARVKARVEGTELAPGARAGAATQNAQAFGREFGATHEVTPSGMIVKPKAATEGVLHPSRGEADVVARRLNRPSGGGTPPAFEFTVHQVGDKFAVVPKAAAERLMKHNVVGTSPATGAKLMRRSREAFTGAVLPFSAKWLAGQGIEAGIRAVVAGAGPADWLRVGSVAKKLDAHTPGAGTAMLDRVVGGAQFEKGSAARSFAEGKTSLADEFAGTGLAKPASAATAIGKPLAPVRAGFRAYSNAVMGTVNGAIEHNARRAMAGQAIKNSPLMEHHLIGLTDSALSDAAKGLRNTENQVALGRAVNDMYGKYAKHSPEMRSALLHWTPFLPWYLNVAKFLGHVLPQDHPVTTALLADTSQATEAWRKSHDLSLLQPNHVPGYLLGSYPKKGGGFLRIAHYTPFGVGQDVTGAAGGLVLPQITGPLMNALGVDWKGQPLKHPGYAGKPFNPGEKAVRALVTAIEEQVPGASQLGAVTGLTPRYVDKKAPGTIPGPVKVLKGYLPWTATKSTPPPARGGSSGSGRYSGLAPVTLGRGGLKRATLKPRTLR